MMIRTAKLLGLAAVLCGLAASPAAAAPSFGVELERDAAVVNHGDEILGYTLKVNNVSAAGGAASAGDLLLCNPDGNSNVGTGWLNQPVLSFQWWRNGEPIPGQASQTYTATEEDEGTAIQCLVKGSNGAGASAAASLPAAVVNPQPATAPPKPEKLTPVAMYAAAKPTITGTGPVERTCVPPTNWEVAGAPFTGPWSYQWLRNGEEIEGAEGEKYLPQGGPGEADKNKVLQCQVVGTGAGGAVVAVSDNSIVGTLSNPPVKSVGSPPAVIANPTSARLELPGGTETFVNKIEGSGWLCTREPPSDAQHASATCVSLKSVAPGSSYPPIAAVAALSPDAPDLAVATATVDGGGSPEAAVATDEFTFGPAIPFGVKAFEAQILGPGGAGEYTQAGGHPFSGVGSWTFTSNRGSSKPRSMVERPRRIITELPRGVVGNALAVPELCSTVSDVLGPSSCPPGSVVGQVIVNPEGAATTFESPIYAVVPEYGVPAQFAFELGTAIFVISPRLRADDAYAITLETAPANESVSVVGARATLCGFGAKVKVNSGGGVVFKGCRQAGEPGANPIPLITNATRCAGPPPITRTRIDTWEHPGRFIEDEFAATQNTGCDEVEFEPQMALAPTTTRADSPTGLDVDLSMPINGLEGKDEEGNVDPEAVSQANLKRARITFPVGMAVNASAGHGLASCSAAQVKLKTNDPVECPDAAKIGTVEIDTPLIRDTLEGSVYIAHQGDVGGALVGMYLVFDSPENGILIKMPGRVDPDPVTGQLVATVDESPEDPFTAVRMHFFGGSRAALLTPPRCGTYRIKAELSPWTAADPDDPTAAETVTRSSSFKVTEGPDGGPCPVGGALDPKLSAGTEDPTAGQTSPFVLRLSREDGSDRFSALDIHTPRGLTAYLKGIPYCPDAALASISAEPGTGQGQIDHPSCPAASQIGTATAGAGAGPDPLFVDTGKVYLAGPYRGAPISLALVAPAVAGPLDLGNVVVRTAIHIDPETAQISAVSDPIPTILHGLLLDVRDIRVALDRPHFTLNPTNCEPMSVSAEVSGESGASANVANRFQAEGCAKLAFQPKLGIRLIGGTHRGGHPQLRTVLTAGPGEADITRAAVTIPRSEFLDQAHIRTICTRVQFAAAACPAGSVYGHAIATTPLLDYPVSGPVYLRSSNHKLPDLVVDLHGPDYQPIEAVVVGRIDSVKGQIRATIEGAPDVPVSKFVLTQQGGKKGLLINSRDICAGTFRATVKLTAQNGMTHNFRPAVKNGKCGKQSKARRGQRRR